jgi:chromosome segregation ATPase
MDACQVDLQKFQEQLRETQSFVLQTLKPENSGDSLQTALYQELEKLAASLAAEREQNSKLSADLSRSLELNLKLQLEVEDVRLKAQQNLREEQAHSKTLQEHIKKLETELELAQAIQNETRVELTRSKDSFQTQLSQKDREIADLKQQIENLNQSLVEREEHIQQLQTALTEAQKEKNELLLSIEDYKKHAEEQHQVLRSMAELASQKMNEVQMALHKKSAECIDLQSRLEQTLKQNEILKQENGNLKQYFAKLTQQLNEHLQPQA